MKELIGKRITITLKNSYTFSGYVFKFNDDNLYLRNNTESVLIIRNASENIVTILIHSSTVHNPLPPKECLAANNAFKEPELKKSRLNNVDEIKEQRKDEINKLRIDLSEYMNKRMLDMNRGRQYTDGNMYDSMAILKKPKQL